MKIHRFKYFERKLIKKTCWIEDRSRETEVGRQKTGSYYFIHFKHTSDFGLPSSVFKYFKFIETKVSAIKLLGFNPKPENKLFFRLIPTSEITVTDEKYL